MARFLISFAAAKGGRYSGCFESMFSANVGVLPRAKMAAPKSDSEIPQIRLGDDQTGLASVAWCLIVNFIRHLKSFLVRMAINARY
jgi:hypothetical protein